MGNEGVGVVKDTLFKISSEKGELPLFLSDPTIPGVRSMGPSVSKWVSEGGFWNLYKMQVMQVRQVMQVMQVLQVLQVLQDMHVMQAMQAMQVMQDMQVM